MSKKEFLKEDVINLLGGATSVLNLFKEEVEERIKDRVEKIIHKLNLIDKDDFNLVKEMLEKSRIENENLQKRIKTLEIKVLKKGKSTSK